MKIKKTVSIIAMSAILTSAAFMPESSQVLSTPTVSASYDFKQISNGTAKFTYTIEDSKYIVIHAVEPKYKSSGTTKVRVTNFIDGMETVIGEGAFCQIDHPITVVFADHIKKVEGAAFDSCTNLQSVQFDEGCD